MMTAYTISLFFQQSMFQVVASYYKYYPEEVQNIQETGFSK